MIFVAIVLVALLALAIGPSLWVKAVIQRHSGERSDMPGTGAEFARHVLDGMKLHHVTVELTERGDHYDPDERAVRLSPAHHGSRSLAAIVIAAHEVGHAMQHATGYQPLLARQKVVKTSAKYQRVAMLFLMAAPVLVVLAKSPAILILQVAVVVFLILSTVAMHVTTLPVEYDASFERAMPLLTDGGFLKGNDVPAAREILRAAAFTYVAAAAMSLFNIAKWGRLLRF